MPGSEKLKPGQRHQLSRTSMSNKPAAAVASGGVSRLNKQGEREQSERTKDQVRAHLQL